MLCIILLTADVPIIGTHGLLAASEVFLGDEGLLVLGDLGEVLRAGADSSCYCGETNASEEFVSTRIGGTFDVVTQIDIVAVGCRSGGDAVRGK